MLADSIFNKLSPIVDTQLSHNICPVSQNGLNGDTKEFGNLSTLMTLSHQLQYLPLPVGQPLILVRSPGSSDVLKVVVQHCLGHGRVEKAASTVHDFYG